VKDDVAHPNIETFITII